MNTSYDFVFVWTESLQEILYKQANRIRKHECHQNVPKVKYRMIQDRQHTYVRGVDGCSKKLYTSCKPSLIPRSTWLDSLARHC